MSSKVLLCTKNSPFLSCSNIFIYPVLYYSFFKWNLFSLPAIFRNLSTCTCLNLLIFKFFRIFRNLCSFRFSPIVHFRFLSHLFLNYSNNIRIIYPNVVKAKHYPIIHVKNQINICAFYPKTSLEVTIFYQNQLFLSLF
jgi:hypothetical protein